MTLLSDDDLDIKNLSEEELALAWDLWFDLAQSTNDADPPYTHGVFQTAPVPSHESRVMATGSPTSDDSADH